MRILLIQPPLVQNIISCITNYLPEPLALQLLAANLSNHDVFLADLRLSDNLIECLENIEPGLVGISCSSMTEVAVTRKLSEIVKKVDPNIHVVIGGQYPTLVPEDFSNYDIDFIVLGEGEIAFSELADSLEVNKRDLDSVDGIGIFADSRLYKTKPRRLIDDIDILQPPDRDIIADYKEEYYNKQGRHVTSTLTTRGCLSRCSFCTLWKFYHGFYRERSPENIYDEVKNLDEELIHFIDDNFLHDINRSWRSLKLFSGLKIKKKYVFQLRADIAAKHPELISAWVDIGLDTIALGLESFRTEDLKKLRKNTTREINDESLRALKNLPLKIAPFFMVSPDYTHNDFDQLIEYIEGWDLKYPIFTVLTPLPGTALYEQVKNDIILNEHKFFDLCHPVVKTRLPYKEFMDRFLGLYKRFYLSDDDILQTGTYG